MSSKSRNTTYTDSVLGKLVFSNSPPWPEWLDSELNSEPWDYPKGGEFSDPQPIFLPRSLQPTDWKRFRQLRYVTAPIVYDKNSNYPDLVTNNRHLLHSEFVRCFVSTLVNLQYYGRNGLEIESPTSNFSWNLGDRCWQGWFNVYSLNKAGKGATHHPLINSNGIDRYVVRLFHMGSWRKILVDDSIPLDKKGRSLLPRTGNPNEIWPLILGKALLKVAGLSWTSKREIADCSLITCLTGWIDLPLNVSHLSPRDQWEFLVKYAKHFEWPRVENEEINQSKFEKTAKSQKSKSQVTTLPVPEDQQPVLLFLNLEDLKDADINEIPGITPCWNHQIYVVLSRDVPLDPTQVKEPLAQWKIYRWLDWAIRQGLIDASDYFVPTRHLLVVSPLGKCRNNFLYAYDETEEFGEEDLPERTLESGEKYNGQPRDDTESDISLWGDFNKISFYLREVHLFYRQKFFKYSVEFSDTVDSSVKDGKKSASRKSLGPPQNVEKIYEYQDKISESGNEPLYLFVDSLRDKFFLVNFSTIAEEPESKMSSLIIEKHNWFKQIEDKSVAGLKTRGTRSMVFQLEPGRHLLRIFVNSQSSYHSIMMSDTPFQIGNRLKMHELMQAEADRINEAARKIDNSIKKAFESFGTESYSSELKIYYGSYMPEVPSTLDKKERKILKAIHDWSIVELFRLIEKHFSQADLPTVRRAIRIFFLDPSIGIKSKIDDLSSNCINEENLDIVKDVSELNQSACLIQSFFRTILFKNYKEIHRASHKEHQLVRETLIVIAELFNDEQKSVANSLLRGIVKRDKFLESLYPWVDDLQHVVQIQEFFGTVTYVADNQWFPIVRTIVNVEKSETVFATVNLFTNLFNYTVRIFVNDTKREMPRLINNVEPNRYRYCKNGYTIFAYGLGNVQKYKELEWSLHSMTIKGEAIFRWVDGIEATLGKKEMFPLCVKEISNIYVPNVQNCIFRIIANVREKCIVSLRLTTSYDNVMTKLRIIRKDGEVLEEIEGGRILILPVVFLEFDEIRNETETLMREKKVSKPRKSSSRRSGESLSNRYGNVSKLDMIEPEISENFTRYTIEAFVRDDSWPLTKDEWAVVMRAKTRLDVAVRDRNSTSGRKIERSKNSLRKSSDLISTLEEPYWSLQIVLDSEKKLEISRDTSKEDKIAELRKIWDTEESGRSERGRKLREKFLEEGLTADEIQDQFYETNEANESTDSSLEISTMTKRTLKPPVNFRNNLSKFDLTIYMEKDNEEEDRWVKSDYDEETLGNQRAMNVLDFQQSQTSFLEESADLIEKRRDKYRRITQRLMENYDDRSRDIDQAYRVRQAYIESVKNTVRSVKSKESLKQKKGH